MYDDDAFTTVCQFITGILICAGLWWVTCWAFGRPFEIKEYVGIMALMAITKLYIG